MATLSDIARLAGVSVSAVSRVLSDAEGTRVSADTRARIHQIADDLGYRPNFAARALKFQRTSVLACIVPDLTNAMFTELLRGIESAASAHGFTVLLSRAEAIPELDATLATLLGEGRVDGVIVQTPDSVDPASLSALSDEKLPVVFVNTVHPQHVGSVILEDAQASAAATRHLIGLGHSRIGFIGGLPAAGSARRRLAGFKEEMVEAGLPTDASTITDLGYRYVDGARALTEVMAVSEPPTGVVVANVNAAMGLLVEARRVGVRVPTQLSVACIHDSWTAETTWPPLTTVRMPLFEMGTAAVASVLERIQNGTSRDYVVDSPVPQLVARESSAAPGPR
ncbi:LacI family DNA-binding transcriptional regulator [Demequina flava]|uniref:LacI family DNA-binding transcriptional regulator n=1 Tax=Demequina flava TaxID=1095025 RepID=UPI0007806BC5|nr:LacI family DNA-binding transcriptional regulator [Demequina flava]